MTGTFVRDILALGGGVMQRGCCVNRTKGRRDFIRTATNVPGRKTIVTAAIVFIEELSRLPSRATKCEFLWFCCEIRLAT